jgi:hypothetical protein
VNPEHPGRSSPEDPHPTSTLRLILSWAVVGVPLLWAVSQVFVKSLALFR